MNEAGHVANMTNQLRAVLYDIRMETMGYAKNCTTDDFLRKCPHCGEIWTLGNPLLMLLYDQSLHLGKFFFS